MPQATIAPPRFNTLALASDADAPPAWAHILQGVPTIKEAAKVANLPVVADVSLARSAVAFADTIPGTLLSVPASSPSAAALRGDPRVEQIKRMMARDVHALRLTSEGTIGLEARPRGQDPRAVAEAVASPRGAEVVARNAAIPGRIGLPDPREIGPKEIWGFARDAVASRMEGLPEAARKKMEALGAALDRVRDARASGRIDDRQALMAVADVGERAFLVAEGHKKEDVKAREAQGRRVDPLFAASATAARAASRMALEPVFQDRGLVGDVVAMEAQGLAAMGKAPRADGDFGATARRLERVGLLDAHDPRARVGAPPQIEPAQALAPDGPQVRAEAAAIAAAFRGRGEANGAPGGVGAGPGKAMKDDLRVEPRFTKQPEATADNSVTQIGWSGAYYAREVSHDTRELAMANKMESEIRARHARTVDEARKEAPTPQARGAQAFGRAALVEAAGVKGHAMGLGGGATGGVFEAAAATAQAGRVAMAEVAAQRPMERAARQAPPRHKEGIAR